MVGEMIEVVTDPLQVLDKALLGLGGLIVFVGVCMVIYALFSAYIDEQRVKEQWQRKYADLEEWVRQELGFDTVPGLRRLSTEQIRKLLHEREAEELFGRSVFVVGTDEVSE